MIRLEYQASINPMTFWSQMPGQKGGLGLKLSGCNGINLGPDLARSGKIEEIRVELSLRTICFFKNQAVEASG